jgi:superfamily II DNA or RNA helicase
MTQRFSDWSSADRVLGEHVLQETERTLRAYATQPTLVREHVGIEENVFAGGYGRRQIFELIQNAADALLVSGRPGRIAVVLNEGALYCANEGAPIDVNGVTAILSAYLSQKRGAQIGHFGLGFKSVLNVTSTPQFFCRAGSFGFDRTQSFDRIRAVLPNVEQVPVLRLAHLLDPAHYASTDSTLAELMKWATTVVRLPRNLGDSSWLSDEMRTFPADFLIFSPHVSQVELDDRVAHLRRTIDVETDDGIVVVCEGDQRSAWAVFAHQIATTELTQAELEDADPTTRRRETLPLAWAVPDETRRSRGRFWAFFPTETETTLSGILNAPWKTNADRQNLLDGAFNRRLLSEFVRIVADAWEELVDAEDPGGLLDLLPARERDEKNWADSALSQSLYKELASRPSVPNGAGELVEPAKAFLRPDEALTDGGRKWIDEHGAAEGEAKQLWVHPSAESRERRPRAERLGCRRGGLSNWLEHIAGGKKPSSSRRALSLIGAFLPNSSGALTLAEVRAAKFVLTTADTLVAPDPEHLCLPIRSTEPPKGIALVHRSVVSDSACREVLAKLGIRSVGVEVQLKHELVKSEPNWPDVWEMLRSMTQQSALAFVKEHGDRIGVKSVAGVFTSVTALLLPGPLIDASSSDDRELIIDTQFHGSDLGLLKVLGASDVLRPSQDVIREFWFDDYIDAGRAEYLRVEPRAHPSQVLATYHEPTPFPLHGLVRGSEGLKERMTREATAMLPRRRTWTFHCPHRPRAYPHIEFLEPARWCLRNHGRFSTSRGVRPAKEAVASSLGEWATILPVAPSVTRELAEDLDMPTTLEGLTAEHCHEALSHTTWLESLEDCETAWRFFALICGRVPAPKELLAFADGAAVVVPPFEVHVTDDRERFNALQLAGIPAVVVPNRAGVESLVQSWGCPEGIATTRIEPAGEAEPLLDVIPGLEPHVAPAIAEETRLQACARIWLEIEGAESEDERTVDFAEVAGIFCYRADTTPESLVDRVLRRLEITLSTDQRQQVLDYLGRDQRRRLVAPVQAAASVAGKLLAAVGSDAIRRQLPKKVIDVALQGSPDAPTDQVLAHAAVAVYGVELLKRFTAELVDAGFDPPRQWNGGRRSLDFCQELGFPPEYAGFETGRRDPMVEVDGPVELKPLHDFQRTIAHRIQAFYAQADPDRGLLSLPTGAGKTRVIVEALIGAMKATASRDVIIWLAQTDELCEQAVQAWVQAWRSIGPSLRLRVSRLWGATNNLVRETDHGHVVVCTHQSLTSRLTWSQYQWLLNARAVVIDEAHGSTAPSYTEILHALGLTAQTTQRHLIGLTATPFRGSGFDEKETRWLANRYGSNRFDQGAMPDEDPYPYLQEKGILARVDHHVVEGREVDLSGDELAHLETYRVLPPAAERRLGDDDARNAAIMESISTLTESWPVLLFATSVNHAQLMAALLSLNGISSKAVSGETDPGARRHYIAEFKAGRIRVLTNYGVLTTGFDAPSVRALVIARPVYSRGLYQQMIGRGLRGPLNGGKDRCLIINVADNVRQFGDRLAFQDFEHLWKPWQGTGQTHGAHG